jgi:RimJ/RimL family protein N-acetyltransferase
LSLGAPPEVIETPRLTLRPPLMADAEAIFTAYAQDAEVAKYRLSNNQSAL